MAYKHKPQQIIKLLPPFNIELTLLHKPPRTLINSTPSITSMPTLNKKPNFVGYKLQSEEQTCKGNGKGHPITGHQGPRGGVKV
jgi:hypothetical protein